MSDLPMTPCPGCATPRAYLVRPDEFSFGCPSCPPRPCRDCGEADDRTCSCWVSIENDSHADLKAMFASMNLSVGLPCEATP